MPPSQPPTLSNRYQLVMRIGAGSFAETHVALDLETQRHVAVKVLRPQFAGDAHFVKRFEREVRVAQSINDDRVVEVLDHGQDGDTLFIVMEWVNGRNLKEVIRERAPLPTNEALRITRDVLRGLDAIHQAGITHRDIKPQNVLIEDATGIAKIADFGIARAITDTGLTDHGEAIGTAAYMSPEQSTGTVSGPSTDLYAVGVMLFELLTGTLPFSGDDPLHVLYQHVNRAPPKPRSLNPRIPEWLERVILQALAKEPAGRYPSAVAMEAALDRAQAEHPTRSMAARKPSRGAFRPGRWAGAVSRPTGLSRSLRIRPRTTPTWLLLAGPVPLTLLTIISLAFLAASRDAVSGETFPNIFASPASSTPTVEATPTPNPTPTLAPTATPMATPTPAPTPTPRPGASLYQADWSRGLGDWIGSTDWTIANGVLAYSGRSGDDLPHPSIVAPYRPTRDDYAVEVEFKVLDVATVRAQCLFCSADFGIAARVNDQGSGYGGGLIYGVTSRAARLWQVETTSLTQLGTTGASRPDASWHTLRLEVRGNRIRLLVDGKLALETVDDRLRTAGRVGLWSNGVALNVRAFRVVVL